MEDIRGNRRSLDDVIVSSSELMNLFPDGALLYKNSNTKATKIFNITTCQILCLFGLKSEKYYP